MVFNSFARIRNLDLCRKDSSTLITSRHNPFQIKWGVRHPLQRLELVDLHFFNKSHSLARHVKFIKLEENSFNDLMGFPFNQLLLLGPVDLDSILFDFFSHDVPVKELGCSVVFLFKSQQLGVQGCLRAWLLLHNRFTKGKHEGSNNFSIFIGFEEGFVEKDDSSGR